MGSTQTFKCDVALPSKLNPVTSLSTLRYSNSGCVQLCPQIIRRGPLPASSMPLASKWQRFVHPEGKAYFVLNDKFEFVVVTESNIEDAQTESRILACTKVVNKQLQYHNIKVPLRCELFLELGEDDASCNYYFVDHVGRGLFWLEDLGTELLDIPAAMSSSHLGISLERLYWVHVEYFPMHHDPQNHFFSQIVEDLYNIISHGQAGSATPYYALIQSHDPRSTDRLTSRTSTFPYTVDSCKDFLELLSKKKGQCVDGYTLCYAARLTGAIMNQRSTTFYGQACAQLDRLQEVYPSDAVEHKWLFTVANSLMWGIPKHFIGLLKDLYMNEQVYVDQWTHFMSVSLADWKNSLSWSLPVFIASILLTSMRGGMVSTSIPCVLCCAISIASASCLLLRHKSLEESSATIGAQYLHFAKSDTLGFLPLSIVFSLPKAGYMWGIGFLIAQLLFIVSHVANKLVALLSASVIAGILVFMLWVLYPTDASFGSLASICNLHFYAPDSHEGESMV